MLRSLCLIALVVATATALPMQQETAATVRVTLRVFSGEEDPSWTTTLPASRVACNAVLRTYYAVLGYRGFSVDSTEVQGCLSLERSLLASGIAAGAISPSVASYVESELNRLAGADTSKVGPNSEVAMTVGAKAGVSNFTPIVGPDTVPSYDPDHDDQGGFETYVGDNNCYNYGSDIVTNTFAQPGRGSGQKWTANTCENMNASAIRDGLEWVGTELPTTQPSVGHYVGLLIWPGTNFHWVRMDKDFTFSHKPGGTPVKNTDNNGETITDASKADLAPWTQFCGYMHVVPSKLTIG